MTFPTERKNKIHVPNHQLVMDSNWVSFDWFGSHVGPIDVNLATKDGMTGWPQPRTSTQKWCSYLHWRSTKISDQYQKKHDNIPHHSPCFLFSVCFFSSSRADLWAAGRSSASATCWEPPLPCVPDPIGDQSGGTAGNLQKPAENGHQWALLNPRHVRLFTIFSSSFHNLFLIFFDFTNKWSHLHGFSSVFSTPSKGLKMVKMVNNSGNMSSWSPSPGGWKCPPLSPLAPAKRSGEIQMLDLERTSGNL